MYLYIYIYIYICIYIYMYMWRDQNDSAIDRLLSALGTPCHGLARDEGFRLEA